MPRPPRRLHEEPVVHHALLGEVQRLARPLSGAEDLTPVVARAGARRFALLGEASHGTSEYYTWRTALTKRLILEQGYAFVAVEGDWPDCYRINRYVKGLADSGRDARAVLGGFQRWPTWMWANEEVVELMEWLRAYNATVPEERKVGFYGLDVYSLWDSLSDVAAHVRAAHPEAADALGRVFRCFAPYGEDAVEYARATVFHSTSCEDAVVSLLRNMRRLGAEHFDGDGREAHFAAEQNAHVIKNAETYYRTMVRGGPAAWNVRDTHMIDTLTRLVAHHGDHARAIVWEHNTHIGDARYTDMAAGGEVNVGQLARERWGEDQVLLVGFAGHRGTVVAGREWDAPRQVMPVPEGRPGSWEDVLHRADAEPKLLLFDEGAASAEMLEPRGHRAIGVVYHPELEHLGNYVPTVLPRRYDALLSFEETRALRPLPVQARAHHDAPDTYPSTM